MFRLTAIQLYENFGTDYPLDKESREWHGLIYNVSTNLRRIENGKVIVTKPDDVVFLRKGSKYRVELEEPYIRNYVINFDCDDGGFPPCDSFNLHRCVDLLPKFEEAARLWHDRREEQFYRLDCTGIACRLIAEAFRRHEGLTSALRKRERLKPALDEIHRRYTDPDFRVSALAEVCGVSPRYFAGLFAGQYGMPPKRYVDSLRFRYAAELLIGGWSVIDTARAAGFADVYHFSASFREHYGIPPGEYRREGKNFILKNRNP